MQKKLLFISINDHVPWGGSEELWSKTALHLSRNYEVFTLTKEWQNEPQRIQELKHNGIKCLFKPKYLKRSKIEKLLRLNTNKHDLYLLNQVDDLSLIMISIGQCFDYKLTEYCKYIENFDIPYVIIVQLATDIRTVKDTQTIGLLRAYQNAKKVYFLSQDNVSIVERTLATTISNKEFINNPFNFNQSYIKPNLTANTYAFGLVASFNNYHKSQDLLISVFSQEKWRSRNFRLNLYGEGINKNQLEQLISLYGLESKIKVCGFERDKSKIWKENVVCIMPSRMEGQSLAMLEAMSYGRMVISTDVGDANRLVVDGVTGYLIDAPTFKLIDIVLEKAWSFRNNWIDMGIKSREHLFNIIDQDPVENFSKKLIDLIK
jgi:glycosyltransferase involved in cell wall biosynthesis